MGARAAMEGEGGGEERHQHASVLSFQPTKSLFTSCSQHVHVSQPTQPSAPNSEPTPNKPAGSYPSSVSLPCDALGPLTPCGEPALCVRCGLPQLEVLLHHKGALDLKGGSAREGGSGFPSKGGSGATKESLILYPNQDSKCVHVCIAISPTPKPPGSPSASNFSQS